VTVDKAPDAFRTISEVAEELDLPQHVLRFWETRFSQIRPMKRGGGRRYYRPDDVDLLRGIRHLLYGEGYTIRGVQRILKDHGVKFVQSVWQAGAPQPAKGPDDVDEPETAQASGGRGLFGLLPSLLGAEAHPGRREPPIEDVTEDGSPGPDAETSFNGSADKAPADALIATTSPTSSAPAARGLAGDDLRKLQATLAELTECRRLLDAALASEP
jgi:DNA-binding transcriptional MerR regulator